MKEESLARQVRWSKFMVAAAIVATITVYCNKFGWSSLVNERDAWGQFGDFFGGVLNPLISFGAFYWLATSILMQQAELSETRDALRETQLAQQHHADTASVTAEVAEANIYLTMTVNELAYHRERQSKLMDLLEVNGKDYLTYDDTGVLRPLWKLLEDANGKVNELLGQREERIELVAGKAKRLRREHHATYSN